MGQLEKSTWNGGVRARACVCVCMTNWEGADGGEKWGGQELGIWELSSTHDSTLSIYDTLSMGQEGRQEGVDGMMGGTHSFEELTHQFFTH